jgi:hypothetical protein
MEGLTTHNHTSSTQQNTAGVADPLLSTSSVQSTTTSTGTSTDAALERSLNDALTPDERASTLPTGGDHEHEPPPGAGNFEFHLDSLDQVASPRSLNARLVGFERTFLNDLGRRGDYLNPKGGNNTVIGSGDSDVIRGTGLGFNTITTGTGRDTIILGRETTNRIFDFDPANDRFVLSGIDPRNIIIAQGKNPGKAGVDQPLDSNNNALILDKESNHILATLSFAKAADLSERHFTINTRTANFSLAILRDSRSGFRSQRGSGTLTGTRGHDRMIGGDGNDFLYVGDDGFRFNTARGGGGTEFPFPTDSPGTSELNFTMSRGVLKVNGSYSDFDGFPLFSQGERELDPNAKILSGANPQALMEGFLRVPKDVEGNLISGTHLHFSPAEDNRGNFADATVVRYFDNTPTDAKSGTIKGEFELKPEEQAALLAGNLYMNIHSNIDGDGDGRAGFATGENRLNINRNVVQFT